MSKSKDNIVTKGLSGTVYDLVFRQWFGKTIVAKKPSKRKNNVSVSQQGIQNSFKKAAIYAKAVITDAAKRLAYEAKAKPGQSAFNMAIADFFKPPSINEVDTTNYSSQAGSTIIIEATDDFQVVSVKVKIEKNGNMVEEGSATLSADGLHWLYTSTASGSISGNSITVTATDMPGHSISKQLNV